MITVVASIIVMFSIAISAFISFSPNITKIMNTDFMRRAYRNANNYSLKYGQLKIRANTLPGEGTDLVIPLEEKESATGSWTPTEKLISEIQVAPDKNLTVDITKKLF